MPDWVGRREVADGRDPVARDPDVGPDPRRPGAVDHGAAADEQVERRHAADGDTAAASSPPASADGPADPAGLPCYTAPSARGYSSAGRAPAWHAGGPGFESP